MGEQDVAELDDGQLRTFTKALLDDLHALERMLESDMMFETRPRRIGAEQEMFLVDRSLGPAGVAAEVLDGTDDDRFVTELGRFNLEANLSPRVFADRCLRELESEVDEVLALARAAAQSCDADVLLTGVLPTLTTADLTLENMMPLPRYHALNAALGRLRGGDDFHILIKGLDELEMRHDNVMLEACNTSFQVHFQVAPGEFAKLYNASQAVLAPVLAAAVNSPLLLGHRLWQETRVALFQRSIDGRSSAHQARGLRPRVSFGDSWIRESVLEIFREDIARYRVVLATELDEDPMAVLESGNIPLLSALRLHNGTVYRWNRPCYGIKDGRPHLRIENRVLPSGPTVIDEVANAAFYFGLMSAVLEEYGRIEDVMAFDDAKDNFFAAARHGLRAQFTWVGGTTVTAAELITDQLLPMARTGLKHVGIAPEDSTRYLDVIAQRVASGQTGSQWMLRSLAGMADRATRDIRQRSVTAALLAAQQDGAPAHTWPLAELEKGEEWDREGYQTVGQFMTTDLLTVRPEDLVDLAASLMDWERIRHVPVEDDEGRLVGVVSHRQLLRLVARGLSGATQEPVAIRDIMRADPLTVTPDTKTLVAMRMMQEHGVGCLPVVQDDKLVGIVTEHDLIVVSANLLEKYLS